MLSYFLIPEKYSCPRPWLETTCRGIKQPALSTKLSSFILRLAAKGLTNNYIGNDINQTEAVIVMNVLHLYKAVTLPDPWCAVSQATNALPWLARA
jgi:hypothetical protein